MKFELTKWYLDCVSAEGTAAIVYAARLRWGWLALQYGALLHAPAEGPVRQLQSLRTGRFAQRAGRIDWDHPGFKTSGTWSGGGGFDPVCLYTGPRGSINWKCLTDCARARIALQGAPPLEGWGYAERLEMTLPPWRLPFDELRWGRFISLDGAARRVWIDWRGGEERRWLWTGDGPAEPGAVSETAVEGPEGPLVLSDPRMLRDATLSHSLLGPARGLGRLLPNRLGRATETKWLSRGVLQSNNTPIPGWAIHEVVKWR